MASTYEHIILLTDKASGTLKKIVGSSMEAQDKFTKLDAKTQALRRTTDDFGGSIYNLKKKIDILQEERDLINPSNLTTIRKCNSEIKKLSKEINKLETINGSKFKRAAKDAFNELPAIARNPITLVAVGLGAAVKKGLSFGDNMAKINITAQFDDEKLSQLNKQIKKITKDNRADITLAPIGFEKIISQTGDVDMSLQILDASMKGAKGGFVDLGIVSGALSQSLSVIGKENASAQQVLDTFFAAKRVGAGEFADFAKYLPGLIAGASNLGIEYKSVAGVFAYMTGKGQSAEKAAVLMENAFSVLGKADIRGNMEKAGISVFDDTGKIRGVVDIFKDMSGVMSTMSNEKKSVFLEQLGIVDKEAKNAFAILTSDTAKLTESLNATANATGETAAALEFSKNPMQKVTELWNSFLFVIVDFSEALMPIVNVGLSALSGALTILAPIVNVLAMGIGWLTSSVGWLSTELSEGNPFIWGVVSALGALTIAYNVSTGAISAMTLAAKAKAVVVGVVAGATKLWTIAQWSFNTALYGCPIIWIVAAIGLLVGAIVWCCTSIQGWGKQWDVMVNFAKNSFDLFVGGFKLKWLGLTNGFMVGLNKIKSGWYEFKNAVGLGDSKENQSAIDKINADTQARKDVIMAASKKQDELLQKTKDSWSWEMSIKDKKEEKKDDSFKMVPPPPIDMPDLNLPETVIPEIKIPNLGGDKTPGANVPKSVDKVIDLNEKVKNLKATSSYSSIVERFSTINTTEKNTNLKEVNNTKEVLKEIPTVLETPIINIPKSIEKIVERKEISSASSIVEKISTINTTERSTDIKEINNTKEVLNANPVITEILMIPQIKIPNPFDAVKSLFKAAAVAIPLSIATPLVELPMTDSTRLPELTTETTSTSMEEAKQTRFQYMCENFIEKLEIHIEKADGEGIDNIKDKIKSAALEVFNEIFEEYEA